MRNVTIKEIKELKEKNFNDPYTERQFIVHSIDDFKYLLENYLDRFAFGINFNSEEYTIFKEDNVIYFRNDGKHNFDFPDCPPPATSLYDIKTEDVDSIIMQVI